MGKWSSTMTTNTNITSQQRRSPARADGKPRASMKLSVLSNATNKTDAPERRRRTNLRTFSGENIMLLVKRN